MNWPEIQSLILESCGKILEPEGYEFVQSRTGFEKASETERRGVYFILIASHHGNYSVRVWCGIRNSAIEEIFHRKSGVEKRLQASYTTINIGQDRSLSLNTNEERSAAITVLRDFVRDIALPFLAKNYSVQDYSNLLNANPEGSCPHHGNRQNRCHYGLIAAKLSGDPKFDELKDQYSIFLRSTNKGFYYPRFQRFLEDLGGKMVLDASKSPRSNPTPSAPGSPARLPK